MEADIITNLLEGTGIEKRRDAIGPRPQSASRQAGPDGDHVLFRNTGIDETWPQGILQRLKGVEAQVAGQENKFRKSSLLD
jgi:hypothetical protein